MADTALLTDLLLVGPLLPRALTVVGAPGQQQATHQNDRYPLDYSFQHTLSGAELVRSRSDSIDQIN